MKSFSWSVKRLDDEGIKDLGTAKMRISNFKCNYYC